MWREEVEEGMTGSWLGVVLKQRSGLCVFSITRELYGSSTQLPLRMIEAVLERE